MKTQSSITPEQLRCWKRWLGTLESMLWVLRAAPMRASKANRAINEEDRSLCRYLQDLIARGLKASREPIHNRQLRDFEDEYRCAVTWFHALQRERDPDWKL